MSSTEMVMAIVVLACFVGFAIVDIRFDQKTEVEIVELQQSIEALENNPVFQHRSAVLEECLNGPS